MNQGLQSLYLFQYHQTVGHHLLNVRARDQRSMADLHTQKIVPVQLKADVLPNLKILLATSV